MSETVGFTPELQAKVDEIVKQRVAREKEKWAKESGTADAVAQLEAKDREMDELKRAYRVGDALIGEDESPAPAHEPTPAWRADRPPPFLPLASNNCLATAARGEHVDVEAASASLDRLIEGRAAERNGAAAAEAAWRASERRHAARLREQRRRDWQDYFMRLADSLRASADRYDSKAEALREKKGTG